jgi:hypothetical protein
VISVIATLVFFEAGLLLLFAAVLICCEKPRGRDPLWHKTGAPICGILKCGNRMFPNLVQFRSNLLQCDELGEGLSKILVGMKEIVLVFRKKIMSLKKILQNVEKRNNIINGA